MKYVTLEHRLTSTYLPHVNFDTNDSSFETKIYELRHQRYSEQEKIKNQILDEINQIAKQTQQIKKELDDLRKNTSILKRFSKKYRTEQDRLQKQYQNYQTQRLKLIKETDHLNDNLFNPFDKYHDLKQLLKERGYVLINKTTSDTHTTTEIWHKDD